MADGVWDADGDFMLDRVVKGNRDVDLLADMV